ILMDMQMPEMDGVEATQKLRKMGCEIPIVALTANVMEKHREQFHQAGGSDFMGKPIDRQALQEMLRQMLPLEDSGVDV
ncbi:MAG: response regulator, partial [Gammaproteobacteria bacterium]|nr:response regulator [Gammaproteobacteria bacterium]